MYNIQPNSINIGQMIREKQYKNAKHNQQLNPKFKTETSNIGQGHETMETVYTVWETG